MARTLKLRVPTDEERRELDRLAPARTAPARMEERMRVVAAALAGERAEAIAVRCHVTAATAYWNAHKHPFLWGRRRRHRPRRQSGIAAVRLVA